MKNKLIVFLCLCCIILTGCGGTSSDTQSSVGYDYTYSDRDLDSSFDTASATVLSLDEGKDISITKEGTYILSGTLSDGQILVETADDEKVQLVLDGVTVSCSDNAPLLIQQSDKVFITLAEGSKNKITGPSSYSDAATEAGIDGVIFSRADLCINGSGTLNISGPAHGIVSKDDLIITGGILDITASKDALQGKDCVKIKDGTFTITSDNDGIRSTNAEDEGRGFISIDGGTFNIASGYDGLQAETMLRIAGGSFDIETGGGSSNSSTQDNWQNGWGGGMPDGKGALHENGDPGMHEQNSADNASSDTISAKALKSGLSMLIQDGTFDIDSSDDSIHCNGDITIESGNISIASGDDGIHADSELLIKRGNISISKSYEGLEGNAITISGGDITLTASDDGLNAAGGNDGSSIDDRPGQNEFTTDESAYIIISGGTLDIDASGDGLDSNGDLTVNGGTIYLSGPENGGNGSMDYSGTGLINGGNVVLTGSSGMAMNFNEGSEQCALLYGFNSYQKSNTEISLKDSSGNTLLSFVPEKQYSCVLFSCTDMQVGSEYTICVDGNSVENITLSSTIMTYQSNL